MTNEEKQKSMREIEVLKTIDHQNVVKFVESFHNNDKLCIVTEYYEFGNLD